MVPFVSSEHFPHGFFGFLLLFFAPRPDGAVVAVVDDVVVAVVDGVVATVASAVDASPALPPAADGSVAGGCSSSLVVEIPRPRTILTSCRGLWG